MTRKFELPNGITVESIRKAAKKANIPSAGKWKKALLLAAAGGRTGQEIADASGLSRAWLFNRKRLLHEPGGLRRSFQRNHGGGPQSRLDANTLQEMTSRFKLGQTARAVHEWLATKQPAINMTIDGVYYHRRALNFSRPRTPSKRRVKAPRKRRQDILRCALDESIERKIDYLLDEERSLPHRARVTLWVLFKLGERTRALDELRNGSQGNSVGHAHSARKIVRYLRCSPKLVYRVARSFRKANGNWDRFVKLAFRKTAQVEINRYISRMPSPRV